MTAADGGTRRARIVQVHGFGPVSELLFERGLLDQLRLIRFANNTSAPSTPDDLLFGARPQQIGFDLRRRRRRLNNK